MPFVIFSRGWIMILVRGPTNEADVSIEVSTYMVVAVGVCVDCVDDVCFND